MSDEREGDTGDAYKQDGEQTDIAQTWHLTAAESENKGDGNTWMMTDTELMREMKNGANIEDLQTWKHKVVEGTGETMALDEQIASTLGLDVQAGPITRQVALALRDGTLVADEIVLHYLRKRSLLAITIDNPKYSGLQQARARWE